MAPLISPAKSHPHNPPIDVETILSNLIFFDKKIAC